MVTPRQFSSYDPALRKLFEAAMEKPVVLTLPTEFDAQRERKHLYAYRDAIKYAKEPGLENLKIIAQLISFKIEGPVLIVYRPRHMKLEAKALAEARAQKSGNPAVSRDSPIPLEQEKNNG